MSTIDDATILRMAADQAEPLMPVLDRTKAFRPLIVVLAILPALVGQERRGLDDAGAVWGLRALGSVERQTLPIEPATMRRMPLENQPPLGAWVTAPLLELPYISSLYAPLVVSLLASAACVWYAFRLLTGLGEGRIGFWVAVWLAVQGTICLLGTSGSPTPLALLAAFAAFDGWERHLLRADAHVSPWLLVSGIAMGLCLLAGGPLVLALIAVLILKRGIVTFATRREVGWTRSGRGRSSSGRWGISLMVAVLTAFALSGWWVMRGAAHGGLEFWWAWFGGYDAAVWREMAIRVQVDEFAGIGERLVRAVAVIGPMLPISLFGLWRLWRSLMHGPAETHRDNVRQLHARSLIAAWFVVSLAFYMLTPQSAWRNWPYRTLGEAFVLFPFVACAALSVEEATQRRVRYSVSMLLTAFVVLLLPMTIDWELNGYQPGDLTSSPVLLTLGIVVLTGCPIYRWTRDRESRRQIALYGLLGIQIGSALAAGLIALRPQPPEENRLSGFRNDLIATSNADAAQPVRYNQAVLISETPPPPRLEFALRTALESTPWTRVESWSSAVPAASALSPDAEPTHTLIVEWNPTHRRNGPGDLRGYDLIAVGKSRFYHGRELRAYLLRSTR